MADFRIEFDTAAISRLLYDPAGGVSREVHRVAAIPILELAKRTISRPYPGGLAPPPGPPYRRLRDKVSPDLRDSLTVRFDPTGSGAGPESYIYPTAVKRGWNYGQILKSRGYRFLPDHFYL